MAAFGRLFFFGANMAAVDFFSGFTYKWAQDGSTYNWEDAQYKQGWSTIGAVPPSVEQFNRVHQVVDEKANWLFAQFKAAADSKGITLAAADLEGLLKILNAATPDATEAIKGLIEIATEAEAQALSDDSRALSPKKLNDAFKGGNQNSSGPGYQRLPGGLIIQWVGSTNVPSGAGSTTITFPIAFPNAMRGYSMTSSSAAVIVSGSNASATTIDVVVRNHDGSVLNQAVGVSGIFVGF